MERGWWKVFCPLSSLLLMLSLFVAFPSAEAAACTAGATQFQCASSTINIPCNNTCDYYEDCPDNSDETSCQYGSPANVDNSMALLYVTENDTTYGSILYKMFGNTTSYASYLYALMSPTRNFSIPLRITYRRPTTNITEDYFGRIAVDYRRSLVYFCNYAYNRLEFEPLVSSFDSRPTFANVGYLPNIRTMRSLAYDWLSTNVYWTTGQMIVLTRFVNSSVVYNLTIVTTGLVSVESLAVDPINNFLFWYDTTGEGNYHVTKSDMNGGTRTSLAVGVPASRMAVDVQSQRLYYLQILTLHVGFISYGVTSPTSTSLPVGLNSKGLSSIALNKDFLFLGDAHEASVYIFSRSLGSDNHVYTSTLESRPTGAITDLAMYALETQPWTAGPCVAPANGGCSHLCVATSSTNRNCRCHHGYTIGSDGTSCSPTPGFSPCMDAGCQQRCVTMGVDAATAVCACNDFFILQPDGVSCVRDNSTTTAGPIHNSTAPVSSTASTVSVGWTSLHLLLLLMSVAAATFSLAN